MIGAVSSGSQEAMGGALIAAGLAGLGWLIRRWVASLTKLVNARGDNIEGQVQKTNVHLILLDDKITSTQISLAEVRGKLDMPVESPLVGSLPRLSAHPWGRPT